MVSRACNTLSGHPEVKQPLHFQGDMHSSTLGKHKSKATSFVASVHLRHGDYPKRIRYDA